MMASRRTLRRLMVALLTVSLAFPQSAFAEVWVDDVSLNEGENAVGGGTATYAESSLDMVDVTASNVWTNESLSVNFNGGNEIDTFQVKDDANVTVSFEGDNEVEDIEAYDKSQVTINMDDDNDFEDIEAHDESSLTVKVSGEVECEAIKGHDDATVTVEGTTCPRKDIIEVGEGEASERIGTERGDLTIKDLTVILQSEMGLVNSQSGNVSIKCSKITGDDDNERIDIHAGGELFVGGSVIDITGSMSSDGALTIRRSDVDIKKAEDDSSPYRIWSKTSIELIEERNGEVRDGELDGTSVKYVDTGDGDEVHLKSSITPCYYRSCDDDDDDSVGHVAAKKLPRTGDPSSMNYIATLVSAGLVLTMAGLRRKNEEA